MHSGGKVHVRGEVRVLPSEVGAFFAPLYWGFVVSTALVGATLIQGYMYYNRTRDGLGVQTAVAFMLALDLSSTVVIAATVSHFFIEHFGDYETFLSVPPEWVVETTLTAIVTCIAQLFFASRIRIIMKEHIVFGRWERTIPEIITGTAFLALVAGIVKTVVIGTHPPSELGGTDMIIATSLEEGLALVSDLFTICALCTILASTQGGIYRKSPIRRLFFFTLNRGILVTSLQIGTLLAFLTRPGHMYWVPFHLAKSKLYTNTLLAMLNSRTYTRSAPRPSQLAESVPLEDVSSGGATNPRTHVERSDRDRVRAWEDARVNWDGVPPLRVPEKRSVC